MKMFKEVLLTVFLTSLSIGCDGYKIMVLFPFPGRSHYIIGSSVVRLLLDAGHDVTFVTVFPKTDTKSLHHIDVSPNAQMIPENSTMMFMDLEKGKAATDVKVFLQILDNIVTSTLTNDHLQKLMNDPRQHFDVIIAEWMYDELYSAVATVFECPFIWVSTTEPHWTTMALIDEATNPAYIPNLMSSTIPPFTFKRRVTELLMQTGIYFFKNIYSFYGDSNKYERIFGPIIRGRGRTPPPYYDVKYNTSLMLGNSHVSLGTAMALPQSYKPLAGWHIDNEIKPLPEDLKKIMESAKEGVIYFSLGSNVKSKHLPEKLKKNLLTMFSSLKQKIIWKFEDKMDDLPKNVHIISWAPQLSILAHKNLRLFITHGGMLSTIESIYFGVPTVGIPVFGDQFINTDRAVNKGYALQVNLDYEMADNLKVTIEEILNNPKYKSKAKELSLIYHDRPIPPAKELVHWVEHVVKTRGALHLRSPALTTPLYQKLYLDLLAIILLIVIILRKTCKILCNVIFRKNNEQSKKKKTN